MNAYNLTVLIFSDITNILRPIYWMAVLQNLNNLGLMHPLEKQSSNQKVSSATLGSLFLTLARQLLEQKS
jgi:hypothetical protein